jgi:hypothetical protein
MRNNKSYYDDYDYKYNNYSDDEATNEEIGKYIKSLFSVAGKAWQDFKGAIKGVLNNLRKNWSNARSLDEAKDTAEAALDAMATGAKNTIEAKETIDEVEQVVKDFEKSIKDFVEEFKSIPKDIVAGTYKKKANESYEITNEFWGAGARAATKIANDRIAKATQNIKTYLSNLYDEWKKETNKNKAEDEGRKDDRKIARDKAEQSKRDAQDSAKAQAGMKAVQAGLSKVEEQQLKMAKSIAVKFITDAIKVVKKEINNTVLPGSTKAQLGAQSVKTKGQKVEEGRFIKTFEGFVYRHY